MKNKREADLTSFRNDIVGKLVMGVYLGDGPQPFIFIQ